MIYPYQIFCMLSKEFFRPSLTDRLEVLRGRDSGSILTGAILVAIFIGPRKKSDKPASQEKECIVKIVYSNGSLTPEEVIKFFVLSGQAQSLFAECIKAKEVIREANALGIKVSDDELQQFADSFRASLGLYSIAETTNFLKNNGLTEEDFEEFCELSVLLPAVKNRLADEKAVKEFFIRRRSELDLAQISSILIGPEPLAKEIVARVREDGEDFHALARQYSLDEQTKLAGGYLGLVTREMLPPDMEAKVFNAGKGEVLGPFPMKPAYQLILVEEVLKAELTNPVKEMIREKIFKEWSDRFWADGLKITL